MGVTYAGIIEAGKGQGLAAAAIVLGYGATSAFIAFLISLYVAYNFSGEVIRNINKVLALITLFYFAYFTWNYYNKAKPKQSLWQQESLL